jgi:hypothetical protein
MRDDPIECAALRRRLRALKEALDNLPRHARRLARSSSPAVSRRSVPALRRAITGASAKRLMSSSATAIILPWRLGAGRTRPDVSRQLSAARSWNWRLVLLRSQEGASQDGVLYFAARIQQISDDERRCRIKHPILRLKTAGRIKHPILRLKTAGRIKHPILHLKTAGRIKHPILRSSPLRAKQDKPSHSCSLRLSACPPKEKGRIAGIESWLLKNNSIQYQYLIIFPGHIPSTFTHLPSYFPRCPHGTG